MSNLANIFQLGWNYQLDNHGSNNDNTSNNDVVAVEELKITLPTKHWFHWSWKLDYFKHLSHRIDVQCIYHIYLLIYHKESRSCVSRYTISIHAMGMVFFQAPFTHPNWIGKSSEPSTSMTLGSTYFKMWIFQGVRVYKNQLNQTNRDFGDEKRPRKIRGFFRCRLDGWFCPVPRIPKNPGRWKWSLQNRRYICRTFAVSFKECNPGFVPGLAYPYEVGPKASYKWSSFILLIGMILTPCITSFWAYFVWKSSCSASMLNLGGINLFR